MPKLPGLKKTRLRQLMTQEELAKKAATSVSTLSRIEGGEEARISTAKALARALGVEPSALLEDE